MVRLLAAFIAVALSLPLHAQTIVGRVIGITDGDTIKITVLESNRTQRKIRLAGIDAPEKRQAFGNASNQNLARMAFNKEVTVELAKCL
jgi:endonuclease YncB( thermonuclease family)